MVFNNKELISKAKRAARLHKASKDVRIGDVGCALITNKNHVYTGVSIDACCGIGFCAEHGAIAAMVTNREYVIKKIVAVGNRKILPPCGRCRELMFEINPKNYEAQVIIGTNKTIKLKNLLPHVWQKV